MRLTNSDGYTMVEVVVAISVAILVIGALTFATISSLRNAEASKRQVQATKLAQEGLEKLRSIRDRDEFISTRLAGSPDRFSKLWDIFMSSDVSCQNGVCYFRFESNILTQRLATTYEDLDNGIFRRQIQIEDRERCGVGVSEISNCFQEEKEVTSLVKWSDFAGEHESRLTTILRKL